MNRQDIWKDGVLIKRGIEWTQPYGLPGYTANPIRGCLHMCQWRMPDGQIVKCYAKAIALYFKKAYPNGFEHLSFHPKAFKEISKVKEPSCIFIDSMSDLFGANVPEDWISQVLGCIANNPQHIFISLTKNPPRLKGYDYPSNMWVGISAPPTFMFGKELTQTQQEQWFARGIEFLSYTNAKVKWVSLEPLSFNIAPLLLRHAANLGWAVIGAGSNGSKNYQPDDGHFAAALAALRGVPVFFKGNISIALATRIAGGWREEFPKHQTW